MINHKKQHPLRLDAGLHLLAGFKSMQAYCKMCLEHPLDHKMLNRQALELKKCLITSKSLKTRNIHLLSLSDAAKYNI